MSTVFFDVDTQFDFLLPAGALPVPGAERIIPTLARLATFAEQQSIPVISTVDAHTEDDPEFTTWKPHCIAGTVGQQKPPGTLLARVSTVQSTPLPIESLEANLAKSAQLLLEKQNIDCFTNPNLKPLLQRLNAKRYIVYGVVTEICVQRAAVGLLDLGKEVEIVTDAIASLHASAAEAFFTSVGQRGARLTTANAITG